MLREDITLDELLDITRLIHKLKPQLKEYFCAGIEKTKPGDKNIVFHMSSLTDQQLVMIATEYFEARYN